MDIVSKVQNLEVSETISMNNDDQSTIKKIYYRDEVCPDCNGILINASGCKCCLDCGFSFCKG